MGWAVSFSSPEIPFASFISVITTHLSLTPLSWSFRILKPFLCAPAFGIFNQATLKLSFYFASWAVPVKHKHNSASHLYNLKFSNSHIKGKKNRILVIYFYITNIISTCNQYIIINMLHFEQSLKSSVPCILTACLNLHLQHMVAEYATILDGAALNPKLFQIIILFFRCYSLKTYHNLWQDYCNRRMFCVIWW